MAEESVGGISTALELDVSSWMASVEKAKAGLESLTRQASGGVATVPLGMSAKAQAAHRATAVPITAAFGVNRNSVQQLRIATNAHLRQMAQGGQAVQVPITLGRVPYSQMRALISRGIGEVPVRIRLDPVGVAGIKSVLTAVLSQTGAGSRSSTAIRSGVDVGVPRRAFGGHVNANQPYLVGERRPEIFRPDRSGRIEDTYPQWVQSRHEAMGGKGRLKITPQEMEYLRRGEHVLNQLHQIGAGRPQTASHRAFYDIERANIEKRAASIGNVTGKQLVDIVAATSSNQPWDKNVDVAEQLIRQVRGGARGTFANGEQANITAAILAGKRVTGVKRLPFADAFYDPNAFPIDRWMGRISSLGLRHGLREDQLTNEHSIMQALRGQDWTGKDVPSPGLRRASVYSIEQAAKRWGMAPREAQAEPWGTVRDLNKEAVKFFRYDKKSGLAVPRWQGGVVRVARDRLPEGYRFAFASGQAGALGQPYFPQSEAHHELSGPSRHGSFKNNFGGQSPNVTDFTAHVIDNNGNIVAIAPFGFEKEYAGAGERGKLHPIWTRVQQSQQGKGLATAMYMGAEAFSGVSTSPSSSQLFGGKGLWAQPNRPFGKRYGDLPADSGYSSSHYDARFDLERMQKTNEKRAAMGLPLSDTTRLEGLVAAITEHAAREQAVEPATAAQRARPIHERLAAREAERVATREAVLAERQSQARILARSNALRPSVVGIAEPYIGGMMGESTVQLPPAHVQDALNWRDAHWHDNGAKFGRPVPDMDEQDRLAQKWYRQHEPPYGWGPAGPHPTLFTPYQLNFPNGHVGKTIRHGGPELVLNSRGKAVDAGPIGGWSGYTPEARAYEEKTRATGGAVLGKLKSLFPHATGIDSLNYFTERDLNLMVEAAEPMAARYPLTAGRLTQLTAGRRRPGRGTLATTGKATYVNLDEAGPHYGQSLVPNGGRFPENPSSAYASDIDFQKSLLGHLAGEARFASDRSLRRADRNDPWLVDPTMAGIFTHEYGHAVDNMTQMQARYMVPTNGVVSKYAKRNLAENFAETFTASELGHLPRSGNLRDPMKGYLDTISAREKWLSEPGRAESYVERQALLAGKALGGHSTKGLYIVNELGREKFVPKHAEGIIPPDVAAQLPGGRELAQRLAMRRYADRVAGTGGGGAMDIPGPEQLWAAPGDGWIIPNRLAGRIPHAMAGSYVTQDANGQWRYPAGASEGRGGRFSGPPQYDPPPLMPPAFEPRIAARAAIDPILKQTERLQKAGDEFREAIHPHVTTLNDPEHQQRVQELQELAAQRTAQRGLSSRSNIGGLFISAFGGRARNEARAQYGNLSRQYEALAPPGEDAMVHFTQLINTASHNQAFAEEKVALLGKTAGTTEADFHKANQAVITWHDNLEQSTTGLEKATKLRRDADEQLRKSQGGTFAQFGAIQAAGITLQIGQQVASFVASAVGDAVKPAVDAITGFGATSTRITADLAKQLPGAGGQTGILFAQQGVQVGLSAGAVQFLQQTLGASVNAKAAAIAQGSKSDLFRAAAGVGNASTGLDTGYGGLFGSSLFAQQLGGGKGFGEQIAGDLATLGRPTGGPDVGGMLGQGVSFLTNPSYAQGLNAAAATVGAPTVGQSINRDIGQTVNQSLVGTPAIQSLVIGTAGLLSKVVPQLSSAQGVRRYSGFSPTAGITGDNLKVVNAYLSDLNDTAARGKEALGDATKYTVSFFKTAADGAKALQAAVVSGNSSAVSLAQSGYGIYATNAQGKTSVATSAQINPAFAQIAQGTNIPDQAVVAATLRTQQKAQIAATAASTAFAVGNGQPTGAGSAGLIGGALGLQLAANPFSAAGTGVAVNFQSKLAPQLKEVSQLQAQISATAVQGIADMTQVVNDNAGPAAAAQFTSYVGDITKTGSAIEAITAQLANQQAAVGAAQYGNSLRIINRSIRDAQGLVTGKGATSGANANLGAVQRLQFELQQQSEQLSVAQSQRQINFSVASAGFQAPGQTGEQRAANIAEAKYEASIAQKQLNIQKQQIPLAATSFNVGAARSLVDLQAQRSINAQEYALSQEQVVAQKRVNALQMAMALSQQRAQKVLDGAVGNWDSALSLAASAAGQYGYELSSILKDIRTGIDKALGISTPSSTGSNYGNGKTKMAGGGVFTTTGATDITVGEADTEHVVVLRNPRALSLGAPAGGGGGGGGGAVVNITISGNSIRSDADLDTLVRRTAEAVERSLNRRGALLGLRSLG